MTLSSRDILGCDCVALEWKPRSDLSYARANSTKGATVAAADGTWDVIMKTPMGDQPVTLTLKTDGDNLSGEADTPMGDQRFSDGTITGDTLSWQVKLRTPLPMTVKFTAKVDGDAIAGTADAGRFGEFEFTGARGEDDLYAA